MGMDLKPINPSDDAPKYPDGSPQWGRYNWTGWSFLLSHLQGWGVPLDEFRGMNDGEVISDETCKLVANAIEHNIKQLSLDDEDWLRPHIALWRTCGGYEQW